MGEQTILHDIRHVNGGVAAAVTGEIGFARSPQLRQELIELIGEHKPARLVLDMAAVPYMDSSGVATLVEAMQQQRQRQASLVLFGMQPRVKSVFEIARLDLVFKIVPDLEAAVAQ